jgi:hypothetical protein
MLVIKSLFLYHPPQGVLLGVGGIAEVELFPELVLFDEEDEMSALDWGQYLSDTIDYVIKLDTLFLYLIFYLSELFN